MAGKDTASKAAKNRTDNHAWPASGSVARSHGGKVLYPELAARVGQQMQGQHSTPDGALERTDSGEGWNSPKIQHT